MSTPDVPGSNPDNADVLKMGCWAEHGDGSLILVESTEKNAVIYSIFDVSKAPPIEYRDKMPESGFKDKFSWKPDKKDDPDNIKWTWHDKTPFPWDRIIEAGVPDGVKDACAEHTIQKARAVEKSRVEKRGRTAAQKVAARQDLKGRKIDPKEYEHMMSRVMKTAGQAIVKKLQSAIAKLKI